MGKAGAETPAFFYVQNQARARRYATRAAGVNGN